MTVVCDSTPLIHLSAMGRLDLLAQVFGEVLIPEAVYREVVDQGVGLPGAREVAAASYLGVRPDPAPPAVLPGARRLGAGERACLALALELSASLVVMDDLLARRVAAALGLAVTGTVGILLSAARRQLVELEPAFDQLLASGFRLKHEEQQRIRALWRTAAGKED